MSDRLRLMFASLGALSTCLAGLVAAPAFAQDESQSKTDGEQYLRVVDHDGDRVALEVGTRRFTPKDGVGPVVALVSVAHIGDASLYRDLQRQLDSYDVVLYESVKPAGAGRPRGETPEERVAGTKASMEFLRRVIGLYEDTIQALPASRADLVVGLQTVDPRIAQWADAAWVDAWGTPVAYQRNEDANSFQLRSLGADAAEGGDGHDADLIVRGDASTDPLEMSSDDNLQGQLADAFGLEFQLEAIDYSSADWICSDMTLDQLSLEFKKQGLDFGQFNGTLAGSSLPGSIMKLGLKLLRVLDVVMEGMFSDMAKVFMIEMLGNEAIFETALENQFGEGFAEVIINQRNQVVVDDLKSLMAERPDVESVAIFYGAGHMKDLEARMIDQLGYERSDVEWTPAISVDIAESQMSTAEVQMIRNRIRTMLQTMR